MTTNYLTRDYFGMYSIVRPGGPGAGLMGIDTLLGSHVYSKEGEDLGEIKEFMLDMATGHIAYVVLAFGGILGMGGKLFAVPWSALTLDTANKRFGLNAPKAALQDASGFDQHRWPTMADPIWASDVSTFHTSLDPFDGSRTSAE